MKDNFVKVPKVKDLVINHYPKYGMIDCRFYRDNWLDISVIALEPNSPPAMHRHAKSYELLTLVAGKINLVIDSKAANPFNEELVQPAQSHELRSGSEDEEFLVISQMIPDLNLGDLEILA